MRWRTVRKREGEGGVLMSCVAVRGGRKVWRDVQDGLRSIVVMPGREKQEEEETQDGERRDGIPVRVEGPSLATTTS